MRYYWDEKRQRCYIRILNHVLAYGHDFHGAASRISITPLTERCHVAVSEALQSHFGCHFTGPTAVGKSETVKELARALGRFFITFDCTDMLNLKTITKILTGLIQTGAWGCFEGMLRMDHAEISVVSQYLRTIYDGVAEHSENIMFDGKPMKLNDNFSLFIVSTWNEDNKFPELPDGLKSFFRYAINFKFMKLIHIQTNIHGISR
jgi:dynein heavy chain